MLSYLLLWMVYGFFGALLIGSSFFVMMHMSTKQGFGKGLAFAFGVNVADPLIAVIVYYSVNRVLGGTVNIDVALRWHIAAIISIVMGIFIIIHKVSMTQLVSQVHQSLWYMYAFCKWFIVNITNPLVWITGIAVASYFIVKNNGHGFARFVTGAFTMVLVTDILKVYYANKIVKKLNPTILKNIQRTIGGIIIVIGLFLRHDASVCADDIQICIGQAQHQIQTLFDKR